ncbi:MAG: AzlC family ABC transporter permease [Gammaproteobacteria bacterium]|nr:AzlC family ABC transporter permease [Gammaproteobacteria bacterium]MDH3535491.1 AzlC family ABC transporter permease [Gammaproteobacteria bacterium]
MVSGNAEVMRKAMLDALSLPAFILLFTMMGFGSLARGAGFGADMAAVASLLIWGLPGQLAMVELTSTGQGFIAIVFACSLANARFLPMVVSFVPAMSRGRSNLPGMLLDAQLLSINSWAVCLREFPQIEPAFRHRYYVTFAASILTAAVTGTLLGYHGAVLLPAVLVLGLIFVSPLFFALVLSAVPGRAERFSMILGCATISIAHYLFPSVDLLITGVVGGSLGFAAGRYWKGGDAN